MVPFPPFSVFYLLVPFSSRRFVGVAAVTSERKTNPFIASTRVCFQDVLFGFPLTKSQANWLSFSIYFQTPKLYWISTRHNASMKAQRTYVDSETKLSRQSRIDNAFQKRKKKIEAQSKIRRHTHKTIHTSVRAHQSNCTRTQNRSPRSILTGKMRIHIAT
jgi:hypothetical protein